MKVLITGSREWTNYQKIYVELESLPSNTIIIHGGARGADSLADKISMTLKLERHVYYAEWDKYGKAAGPIRNQLMLDVEKPDLVIAFHSDIENSKGTKDMVTRAKKAGVKVNLVI